MQRRKCIVAPICIIHRDDLTYDGLIAYHVVTPIRISCPGVGTTNDFNSLEKRESLWMSYSFLKSSNFFSTAFFQFSPLCCFSASCSSFCFRSYPSFCVFLFFRFCFFVFVFFLYSICSFLFIYCFFPFIYFIYYFF